MKKALIYFVNGETMTADLEKYEGSYAINDRLNDIRTSFIQIGNATVNKAEVYAVEVVSMPEGDDNETD